jgi:hypothetical protein
VLTDRLAAAAAAALHCLLCRDDLLTLAYAVGMGGLVATSVFIFDVSIQYVHDLPDIFAQVGAGQGYICSGEAGVGFSSSSSSSSSSI